MCFELCSWTEFSLKAARPPKEWLLFVTGWTCKKPMPLIAEPWNPTKYFHFYHSTHTFFFTPPSPNPPFSFPNKYEHHPTRAALFPAQHPAFPQAGMSRGDLQAAFLPFFLEQAARLQGRAGTARRSFRFLERRARAATFTPLIAALQTFTAQQSFPTASPTKHPEGCSPTEGWPGFFRNRFKSTLSWLRGGANPGVNFQLVPALSSSFSAEAGGLMIIPLVLPKGFFFSPHLAPRTGMVAENSLVCKERVLITHTVNLSSCVFEYW